MIHRDELFARLAAAQPPTTGHAIDSAAMDMIAIDVVALVSGWLRAGPRVFAGADRAALDALCRQVDVRRRISRVYGPGWSRLDPAASVEPATAAGVVAVLLANAAFLGRPLFGTAVDGGWGLKCANSALKVLDLFDAIPAGPELAAWALTVLDGVT